MLPPSSGSKWLGCGCGVTGDVINEHTYVVRVCLIQNKTVSCVFGILCVEVGQMFFLLIMEDLWWNGCNISPLCYVELWRQPSLTVCCKNTKPIVSHCSPPHHFFFTVFPKLITNPPSPKEWCVMLSVCRMLFMDHITTLFSHSQNTERFHFWCILSYPFVQEYCKNAAWTNGNTVRR
jgi:hypothetical protein